MPATRICVLCPAYHATGGTEALHQLVHELRRLGHAARIHYLEVAPAADGRGDPTPARFRRYDAPAVDHVDDAPRHVVVIPEVRIVEARAFT